MKIKKSCRVIQKALERWKCGVAFSGGKDSLVLLHLVRQQKPDVSVIFNDTTVKFQQTYDYIDMLSKDWDLNIHSTQGFVPTKWYEDIWLRSKKDCCFQLKVVPTNIAVRKLGLQALFVGIRADEHVARKKAKHFDMIGGVTHMNNVRFDHWRVHPLLKWTEDDVWSYIKEHELPYNPLYGQGYRSVGCEPCTGLSVGGERSGREHDKEKVLERLRRLGYF